MKRIFVVFGFFLSVASYASHYQVENAANISPVTSLANSCPNLTGFYWEDPSDKPQDGFLGRMMELRQQDCDKLLIYIHWVDVTGKIVDEDKIGYVWNLDGSMCSQTGQRVDCRVHKSTADAIVTLDSGVTSAPHHQLCLYSEFRWSIDASGNIVETTPVTCEDGFKGDLTRFFERIK